MFPLQTLFQEKYLCQVNDLALERPKLTEVRRGSQANLTDPDFIPEPVKPSEERSL
jgi:hypothetical protein